MAYGSVNVPGVTISTSGGNENTGGDTSTTLADYTPSEIQSIAQSMQGANYWSVGDSVPIKLNGTVGEVTFFDDTYYAFIIGFEHNNTVEGHGIHFQFGKTKTGIDIAFTDGKYNTMGETPAFRMELTTKNNGWEPSYMRNTICPAFFSTLPTEWQNVIVPCTKYTKNSGVPDGSNMAECITATSDNIFLLAEYEVYGVKEVASLAESNYQKQYAYYANGNSTAKYKYSSPDDVCYWWLRSPCIRSTGYFCHASAYGSYIANSSNSYGFAPAFKVA